MSIKHFVRTSPKVIDVDASNTENTSPLQFSVGSQVSISSVKTGESDQLSQEQIRKGLDVSFTGVTTGGVTLGGDGDVNLGKVTLKGVVEGTFGVESGKNNPVSVDGQTRVYTTDDHYVSPASTASENSLSAGQGLKTTGAVGELFAGLKISGQNSRWSFDIGPKLKFLKAMGENKGVFAGSYGVADVSREASAGVAARLNYALSEVVSLTLGTDFLMGTRVGHKDNGARVTDPIKTLGFSAGLTFNLAALGSNRVDLEPEAQPTTPAAAPQTTPSASTRDFDAVQKPVPTGNPMEDGLTTSQDDLREVSPTPQAPAAAPQAPAAPAAAAAPQAAAAPAAPQAPDIMTYQKMESKILEGLTFKDEADKQKVTDGMIDFINKAYDSQDDKKEKVSTLQILQVLESSSNLSVRTAVVNSISVGYRPQQNDFVWDQVLLNQVIELAAQNNK